MISTLIVKNLRIIFRSPMTILLIVLAPIILMLLVGISFSGTTLSNTAVGLVNGPVKNIFDYGGEIKFIRYDVSGSTSSGAYLCDGDTKINSVVDGTFGYDRTLRLSNCAHGDGAVSLDVDVNSGADKIKLVIQESTGGSSVFVKIDGIDFGHRNLGLACEETELIFDGLSSVTADGVVKIELSEGVPNSCAGDPQMTFLEVYSN